MIPLAGSKEFEEYIINISEGKYKHKYFDKCKDHHECMEVHVDGEKPNKLLKINRPNEPEDVRKYRLEVYKPVTKSSCDKVVNTVSRIFNPRLYRIVYKDNPPVIKEGEGLHEYLSEDYPFYINLMTYISEVGLRQIFSDPNGIIIVWPQTTDVAETEYFKPIPIYIESDYLYDFEDDKYYVWTPEGDKKTVYILDNVSKRKYVIGVEPGGKQSVTLVEEYVHGLGIPTAFRIGGVVKGNSMPYYYESFIAGILPHWDKVVTMTSDLDGSIVNHLYMESYEWQVECDTCHGSGKHSREITFGPDAGKMSEYSCNKCTGTGRITSRGPFGQLTINREALNPDSPIPTPPKDYIKKDIEPVRELKLIIKEEKEAGFAAINMEILNKVGENQSGVAKTIDRQDLDSFLLRVSNHVFKYFLPNIIYYTALWRYSKVTDVNEYLPVIHAPKDFGVLSVNELMSEYQEAAKSKVSQSYLRRIEEEIVNTKFGNNEMERLKNLAIIRLNPFPNKSSDDLLSDLASASIKREDWIKTNYIEMLVDIAIKEDEGFLDLEIVEKNDVIDTIIKTRFSDLKPPTLNVPTASDGEN